VASEAATPRPLCALQAAWVFFATKVACVIDTDVPCGPLTVLRKTAEARNNAREMANVTKQLGDVFTSLKAHNPAWTEQMNDALLKACT
jgi:hypothetical protein